MIIDCDVHNDWSSAEVLLPYLDPAFRDYLAEDSELLATTLTSKLLTFATGRELGFSDRAEIERIVKASAEKGYGVRDLVHLVVQSEIFRSK